MREGALKVGIQDPLRRHRKAVPVDRTRLETVAAHVTLACGLKFQCITVDDDGVVTVFKQETTDELMQTYYERTSYW